MEGKMVTIKQIFKDFGKSFLINKFPTFKFTLPVLAILTILVTIGGLFFHYQGFFPSKEYTLFIKMLPKAILLFLLTWYNLRHGSTYQLQPINRLGYFPSFIFLILLFSISAFLTKEFAGKLVINSSALKCISSEEVMVRTSLTDVAHSISALYSRLCTPLMPMFLIRAIPAIILTAYFQLVISNMLTLLIVNTKNGEKNEVH